MLSTIHSQQQIDFSLHIYVWFIISLGDRNYSKPPWSSEVRVKLYNQFYPKYSDTWWYLSYCPMVQTLHLPETGNWDHSLQQNWSRCQSLLEIHDNPTNPWAFCVRTWNGTDKPYRHRDRLHERYHHIIAGVWHSIRPNRSQNDRHKLEL